MVNQGVINTVREYLKLIPNNLGVKKVEEENDLTKLLLNGPTMTNAEEAKFKKFNEEFDKWTKSLYA